MKKTLLALAVVSLVACKKNEDANAKTSTSIGDVVNGAKTLNNLSASMDDIEKKMEELKTTTPATNDELKSIFPSTSLGLARTEIKVGDISMMGLASAEAKYSDNANKNVEISIMDGAGEAGSGMLAMLMMALKAESEKTSAEGYEKTTNFNNVRASISEKKNGDIMESEIQYLVKNRYAVKIEGEGYTLDQLKAVMSEINTSSLK
ncbi:hypothetical protein [Soonwooa sp.]|uniref:hypothetical protein n=1 Tax=Soonwooa sp. TaxID=1938592 RepID=UPI0028ACB652|nr:hypothetical protein [Soonwooa sp.]